MKSQTIVKTLAHERLDSFDMVRREIGAQHDLHRPTARQLNEQMVRLVRRDLGRSEDARHRRRKRRRLGGDQRKSQQRQCEHGLAKHIPPQTSLTPLQRRRFP